MKNIWKKRRDETEGRFDDRHVISMIPKRRTYGSKNFVITLHPEVRDKLQYAQDQSHTASPSAMQKSANLISSSLK